MTYAFTEHGAIQVATILSTRRAIDVSVYVVRAFVQLRGVLATNRELAKRLEELEARIERKIDVHDRAVRLFFFVPSSRPSRPLR